MTKNTTPGVWLDSLTGKIVRKEPERGRILVHPGADIPEHLADAIAGEERAIAPQKREKAVAKKAAAKKPKD